MKITLTKMCGSGNDFLITDETLCNSKEMVSELVSKIPKLCDRKFGIGADGFCFLSRTSSSADLKWDFFNKDGSIPYFCGNAGCCIVDYALQKKLVQKNPFTFEIQNHLFTGGVRENKAWIQTPMPRFVQDIKERLSPSKSLTFKQIDSGVLHLVLNESETTGTSLEWAQKLRKKYPDSNITFYTQKENHKEPHKNPTRSFARTFERGVEDFTLACGTGALAVSYLMKDQNSFHKVEMPGGVLDIFFKDNQAYLQSPTQWIADVFPFL